LPEDLGANTNVEGRVSMRDGEDNNKNICRVSWPFTTSDQYKKTKTKEKREGGRKKNEQNQIDVGGTWEEEKNLIPKKQTEGGLLQGRAKRAEGQREGNGDTKTKA